MKKNTYNYSAVNARAAALYREAVREYPEARNRATWAACMREAVKEYREAVKNYNARAEWESMTGENQLDLLKRAAAKMPDFLQSVPYIDDDGNKAFRLDKCVLWMVPESRGGQGLVPWAEAVETVASEAWIILAERMEAYDGGKPLVIMAYDACKTAVRRLDRLYHDAPRTKRTQDGKQISLYGGAAGACEWNDISAARAPHSLAWKAESPEAAYISREAVADLTHDENDKRILAALEKGFTQKEIAAAMGISQPAIAKRVRNMKNRRVEQIGSAEAWMRGYSLK